MVEKFNAMFSHFDTVHEFDRQTDGQKCRSIALAEHRAVKINRARCSFYLLVLLSGSQRTSVAASLPLSVCSYACRRASPARSGADSLRPGNVSGGNVVVPLVGTKL